MKIKLNVIEINFKLEVDFDMKSQRDFCKDEGIQDPFFEYDIRFRNQDVEWRPEINGSENSWLYLALRSFIDDELLAIYRFHPRVRKVKFLIN